MSTKSYLKFKKNLKKKRQGKKYTELELMTDACKEIETLFKAEGPFTEIKNGYGFYGVVIRDKIKDKVQCHICGQWFDFLSPHIAKGHKIKVRDYKKKYGLPLTFPLCSRKYSKIKSNQAKSFNNKDLIKARVNLKKRRKQKPFDMGKRTLAFQNKHGTCPKQLETRYLCIADMLGRTPSMQDLKKYEPRLIWIITKRYGSFNNFKKEIGLDINEAVCKRSWTETELLAILRNFFFKFHRVSTSIDFTGHSPCTDTYQKVFGSWSRAMEMAGYTYINPCKAILKH